MNTVYLCGPITGLTVEEAKIRRQWIENEFQLRGVCVRNPMRWPDATYTEDRPVAVSTFGESTVAGWDKSIVCRDLHDVKCSDVVVADFRGSTRVSIGSVAEIGWAHALGVPVVTIMSSGGPHDHGFIHQMSVFVTADAEEAVLFALGLMNT